MKKISARRLLDQLLAKDKIKELNEQDEPKSLQLDISGVDDIQFQEIEELSPELDIKTTVEIEKLNRTKLEKTDEEIEEEIEVHLKKHAKYNIDGQIKLSNENDEKAFDDLKKKEQEKNDFKQEPHYHGHRNRLRQKILETGPENLKDYELLEALLMYSIPRADTKPLAKKLLEHFKTLQGIFLSDKQKLKQVKGVADATSCFFSIIHEVACRMLREEIINSVLLNSPEKVINYCRLRMSGLSYEQFYVLFLNRKNKLILDEVVQSGTIDKAAIFPRELVKRAIDLGAGAMILVHNHPSGDPTPSKADIESTINIQKAASLMEIFLYDHIIIGKNSHYSMRSNRII